MTVVVEMLDPPEVFEWFADLRRSFGMNVVPLGPEAGGEVVRALKANHVVCLLCDRDIGGGGVEVEFFGERTRLPGGPATLAFRTGAPLIPTAAYFRGRGHLGVCRPPIPVERQGKLRDDVTRITQLVAYELEELIRRARAVAPDATQLAERPRGGCGRRSTVSGMRVGLVCPYSLTTPGGVQGQVLGLARSLRNLGHDARVLGPCDGPPPDAGVTPLGRSVPTAANGSVAPIAPDPSAQLRTIRALRDEGFDVLNLHEPLVPGPCMTSILFRNAPIIGTFHAAGGSAAYRYLNFGVRWLAARLDHRCAVSADARQMAHDALGGEYTLLFNGIEVDRFAKASPWPTDGPTIFFVGRHEPRKGLAVLLDAMRSLPSDTHLWVAGDGPETARCRRRTGATRASSGSGASTTKRRRRGCAAPTCSARRRWASPSASCCSRGWRRRPPSSRAICPGYHNVARSGADAILVPPGDAAALSRGLAKVLENPTCAERLVAPVSSGPRSSRWTTSPRRASTSERPIFHLPSK